MMTKERNDDKRRDDDNSKEDDQDGDKDKGNKMSGISGACRHIVTLSLKTPFPRPA